MYTIQPDKLVHSVTLFEATCSMHVYLAVTCHWHFWQYDLDLLRATVTVVTVGWNRYRNMSQHRQLTVEKKVFPPGLEPETLGSLVHCSTTELSPLPVWE